MLGVVGLVGVSKGGEKLSYGGIWLRRVSKAIECGEFYT